VPPEIDRERNREREREMQTKNKQTVSLLRKKQFDVKVLNAVNICLITW
jgi:hypothetical protein